MTSRLAETRWPSSDTAECDAVKHWFVSRWNGIKVRRGQLFNSNAAQQRERRSLFERTVGKPTLLSKLIVGITAETSISFVLNLIKEVHNKSVWLLKVGNEPYLSPKMLVSSSEPLSVGPTVKQMTVIRFFKPILYRRHSYPALGSAGICQLLLGYFSSLTRWM